MVGALSALDGRHVRAYGEPTRLDQGRDHGGEAVSRRRNKLAKAVDPGIPDQRTTVPAEATAGVSGTPVYGGFIQTIEKNPELQGDRRWLNYSEILLNVSIVAAGTRYFLNLVSQPDWRAEAAEGSGAEGERIAKLVTEMMKDMVTPWNRVIRRAALFRFYGFSTQEWTAKRRDDGAIGMLDVEVRPQNTITKWDTDTTGTVLGVVQTNPLDGVDIYLPRRKLIYAVDDSLSDSPEGLGLFRHCYETARQLKRYEQLEGWGFETDLRGIPYGRAPFAELDEMVKNKQITAEQRDEILKPITKFIQGHIKNPQLGILLDSMTYESQDEAERASGAKKWEIDLLKAQATGQPDIARAIERKHRELARILGVESLLLGDNGVGSFAMAKDKSHNFFLQVDGTLRDLIQVITADWLTAIMLLNGWDMNKRPTLKCDKLQYRSIEQVTAALRDMASAGAILPPNDPVIKEVRDLLGLSRPIEVSMAADASLTPRARPKPNEPEKEIQ